MTIKGLDILNDCIHTFRWLSNNRTTKLSASWCRCTEWPKKV